jgi:HD-GYP domain-containing protein (c-di-GMP phosphodiesterase class II)
MHAQTGYDIIKGIEFPWPIAECVLQHHERLDGSGYPKGLAGEAVILEARILAVADVTEAITAHRPYRPAMGLDAALAEIESGKGRLYDPAAVDACIALFRKKGFAFK